jgi:hypothetical protein
VSPTELVAAVAALKRRLAGDAAATADQALPQGSVEKKKHELPPQLSAAFDSLAATAAEASITPQPVAPKTPIAAPPAPPPRVLSDASDEDEAEDDAEAQDEDDAASPDVLRSTVIEALGRSSPLLKTGLASSLPWRVEQTKLVIPFRSGMEESVVRGSIADIAAKVSELAGRPLKVELKVEQGQPSAGSAARPIQAGPDPVEIVERVFRGARVPDNGRGERDEHR